MGAVLIRLSFGSLRPLAFISALVPLAAFIALGALSGCSSSTTNNGGGSDSGSGGDTGSDAAVPCTSIDAGVSICGKPCDKGNALGVGLFCQNFADCSGTASAHLCSVIGDSTTHFCTKTCQAPADGGSEAGADDAGAGASQCGDNATCACGGGGCGCTPNSCLGP